MIESPLSSETPATPPHGSRRRFITRAAAVAGLPLVAGLFAGRKSLQSLAATAFSLDVFQPHVGTVFTTAGSTPLSLALTRVEAHKQHQPQVAEQFSLIFSAPEGQAIESQTYTLQHPVLGSLELFISPIGPSSSQGQPQIGEAVFNFAQPLA